MSGSVSVEPLEITAGENKELQDLVVEQQALRATSKLQPSEVPGILLPYQIRWHQDRSNVRIAEKSRRIGWSWGCVAAEGALEAAADRGMNQYYMGYNIGMAAENIGDALTFARAYGMVCSAIDISREREVIGEKKQDITRFRLTFASGHIYEALSSSPWNWRGRQGHALIDEAAFHRDLQEVIKGALAFLMWGGRVDIISTHNSEENYFYSLIRDVKAGRLPWSLHHIDFDQAIREGFYKRICLVTGRQWSKESEQSWRNEQYASYPSAEDADEELGCIAKKGSGAYFSRLLLEQCMVDDIPVLRWAKPAIFVTDPNRIKEAGEWIKDNLKPLLDNLVPGARTAYGQDFGRNADCSPTWVAQEYAPGRWRMAFALELWRMPFDVQALIRDFILNHVPLLHHASFDARGNGQSHAEGALQLFGERRISCIQATPSFYGEYFPKYRQAFEDRSLLIARNEDFIADHRHVISVRGNPSIDDKRDKGSNGEFRHGDSASAGLMLYHAICQDSSGPVEFEGTGQTRVLFDDGLFGKVFLPGGDGWAGF